MKNLILGISLLAVVFCGFMFLEKDREANDARARAAAAESQRQALAATASEQEQFAKRLQSQLRETRSLAVENASENVTLKQKLAGAAPAPKNKGNPIFRDPQMKQAMQDEAREGIEKNIAALFKNGLAEQLHLDETQSAALKTILTQKQTIFWEGMLFPMMTGEIDDADMSAAGQKLRQEYQENQAQLRALLGDDGVKSYESFEKMQSERDDLKKLASQMAKSGQPMTDAQGGQLLAVMVNERANFKSSIDFDDPSKLDLDHWYANFSEDKLTVVGQEMEQMKDRVVQRAGDILTPDQAAALNEFLTKKLIQGKFVMHNTTALMAR